MKKRDLLGFLWMVRRPHLYTSGLCGQPPREVRGEHCAKRMGPSSRTIVTSVTIFGLGPIHSWFLSFLPPVLQEVF